MYTFTEETQKIIKVYWSIIQCTMNTHEEQVQCMHEWAILQWTRKHDALHGHRLQIQLYLTCIATL